MYHHPSFLPLVPLYNEPHRHYHSMTHVHSLLRLIEALPTAASPEPIDSTDSRPLIKSLVMSARAFLTTCAWFHDAYYDPYAPPGMNEEMSVHIFNQSTIHGRLGIRTAVAVEETIRATARHGDLEPDLSAVPTEWQPYAKLFMDMDLHAFSILDWKVRERIDADIKAEYYQTQRDEYYQNTIAFLHKMQKRVDNGTFFLTDNYHHRTPDVRIVIQRTIAECVLQSET